MNSPKIHKHTLKNLPIAILGIPTNNLDLAELISFCLEIIEKNKLENKVSYLSTIDEELIAECYGWMPTSVSNPELLLNIRNADICSLSGILLRGLAKLLGSKICSSYSCKDFLFSLCQAVNDNEMGIFILGGIDKEIKTTVVTLHERFKKLRLVGITSPPIFLEGEDLINAKERDLLLIEQINSSNADVLLVNLGNMKQTLWIERVKHLLSIPLVVTLGYTTNEIEKDLGASNKGKPSKIHKKFSFLHFLKFTWMSLPLIFFHSASRFLSMWFSIRKKSKTFNSRLFLSSERSIAFIELPKRLDHTNVSFLQQRFEDAASHDVIVFDFSNVYHIQPEGFYFLIKTWLQRIKKNKEIYCFSPSDDIQYLMKLHRTWDIFKNTFYDSVEILMSRLARQEGITFYDTFTQNEQLVTISLLGSLDNHIDYQRYIKKITPVIEQKNCCIDFRYCTFVDNTGFSFLLNLRKQLKSHDHELFLSSVNKTLRQQFHKASVEEFFTFV